MTRAIMCDLETLGTDLSAVIVSIGAVTFDPYAEKFSISEHFHAVIQVEDQDGRVISQSTLWWWMQQAEEARKIFNPEGGIPLETAIELFNVFLGEKDDIDEIWGNGADFDIALLKTVYDNQGKEYPWSYKATRCFRTMKELWPKYEPEFKGIKHDALADAVHQATWLWEIMQDNGVAERVRKMQVAPPEALGL